MDMICGNCVYYRTKDVEHGYCIMEELNVMRTRTACHDAIAHGRLKSVAQVADPVKPPEPQKAYVIVSGEYSDYTVNAVFLDKEEAERAAEIANRKGGCFYDDHRVLEFNIGVPCDLEKFDLYSAYFNKEGHVTHASKHSWLFSDEVNQVRVLTGPYRNNDYCIDVYATDEEHAKKIAADIFAKWKAEKEGIT